MIFLSSLSWSRTESKHQSKAFDGETHGLSAEFRNTSSKRWAAKNLESAVSSWLVSWLGQVRTSYLSTGHAPACVCFMTFEVRGPQTSPSEQAFAAISEHTSHEGACSLVTPGQKDINLAFFLFPITFPHTLHASEHAASLSLKYPSPSTLGDRSESCSCFTWLSSK